MRMKLEIIIISTAILVSLLVFGCVSVYTSKLNINMCTKVELLEVEGIGEKTADDIIEHRPYNSLKEVEYNCKTVGKVKYKNLIINNFEAK